MRDIDVEPVHGDSVRARVESLDSDCLPRDLTCADERYGDGTCDDGCGATDADDFQPETREDSVG